MYKKHEPVSRPSTSKVNQHGGKTDEAMYEYKAKKYHYKIQQKLGDMMRGGAACPAGYERYLKPYKN